ncbi:MAG: tRNA (adenosine(37)-N6)-dimethylallyltransferase MiaA [Candidatus Staskawiczbacteria bacterium RIFCSPLOWO2_01_FULL_40_39]|uniref:tRNA dimethylallyltransferase n=1 Tax=Candidatus Staskawiczbacteria bacterium RIFCSPHIGHO2_01_FULL_39_25 TaxID=1802202 RepID=A0A1G2HRP5_9BACT|nr:MAG: tRNA (adenosine(37)-N6)-dimethylallyltransferase MiaA [Candidatus Staskawiczbacteria bacterium RIFCSPHIGHO2_01_FULL_39_25]OGZ72853.1 MAG: tRNA (adenosine(37)-N6)-dimethylallyltransferase MiaA [Candidatus Staskawiczbacteria bacterium RIFCSPLOWO2_01_FULL_40_39]OGZ75222.1 MAG: tRNA (adenosine(37)-N6)-dimethylallyltransferase MiaA [Candidatus Staskawiczbacteria bacterium RIFCSPLOWO2_02_FULL_39_8]
MRKNNKIIVILGPTASGKTALSITLAKRFNGEIISTDSRQVYKGLNIGSGKITKKEMKGIPHHLLDVANPKRKFTVAQFQTLALKKIQEIQNKGKIPFLVGGTGFYIQSVVDGIAIPEVKPNWKLRKKLDKKSVKELFLMLKKLDPRRAKNIDPKNPHRLIRAIEIVLSTNKPVPKIGQRPTLPDFNILQIGIKKSPEELKKLIHQRLQKRLKGMIIEVKKLHQNGLSWKRLEELGLEYRFVAQYLQDKITYQEMIDRLQKEIEQFARRQMTWFKRDKRIHWVRNKSEAEKLIKKFLK